MQGQYDADMRRKTCALQGQAEELFLKCLSALSRMQAEEELF